MSTELSVINKINFVRNNLNSVLSPVRPWTQTVPRWVYQNITLKEKSYQSTCYFTLNIFPTNTYTYIMQLMEQIIYGVYLIIIFPTLCGLLTISNIYIYRLHLF